MCVLCRFNVSASGIILLAFSVFCLLRCWALEDGRRHGATADGRDELTKTRAAGDGRRPQRKARAAACQAAPPMRRNSARTAAFTGAPSMGAPNAAAAASEMRPTTGAGGAMRHRRAAGAHVNMRSKPSRASADARAKDEALVMSNDARGRGARYRPSPSSSSCVVRQQPG